MRQQITLDWSGIKEAIARQTQNTQAGDQVNA